MLRFLTSPLNLPAPGRRQLVYFTFRFCTNGFAQTCVFVKQLLGPILCDSYLYESPLSLTYGVMLPSSLTRVFSRVLEFSSYPPVSVYGTGTYYISLEVFLVSITRYSLTSTFQISWRIFLSSIPQCLDQNPLIGAILLPPSLHQYNK